ncbi:unnamed protein product [Cylicocyclus nassatus]|uniref:Uncharacterized protein n=1 Tax=Cylicocyclus nassatus TaxID=53992 RepID=A0AA36GMI5_CYLNA|nr:unnamed protein product [Cylicocyclus nassatus]
MEGTRKSLSDDFNTQPVDGDSSGPTSSSSSSSSAVRHAYAILESLMEPVPRIELREETFICGRGVSVQVHYDFGVLSNKPRIYNFISRQQFRLDRKCGRTILTDLSFNGTYVNKTLVGKTSTRDLVNGDVISCGRSDTFIFVYKERSDDIYPAALTEKYIMTDISLGKGGYGVVLLGKLRRNCSEVAVKIVDIAQLSRRFSRIISKAIDVEKEVNIMLQISHPNCVQFMDWIETDKTAYIVMEKVGGGELFDRIVDPKWNGMGFGEDLCKFYAWQLLSAVEYLHERSITHRDIKPENILCMTKDDYTIVKLADFGLAKDADASTMKTYCGTPNYMAPEMMDNEKIPYNPRVDMWSLGVVLFTGISGYPPFSDDYQDMDLRSQIKKGRLIFHNQWKYVTLETQHVIKMMLRVDPILRVSASDALKKSWLQNSEPVSKAKAIVAKFVQERKDLDNTDGEIFTEVQS